MRIYFTASVRGKSEFVDNYRKIVDFLKKKGHKVSADHIFESDKEILSKQSDDEVEGIHKSLLTEMKKSDLVVAEVSFASVSVGYEITEALEAGKPVLVLFVGGHTPNLLRGKEDDKLQLIEYSLDNLNDVLENGVDLASKGADVRFNFFVSPKILAYLDWVAKTRRIPRSVFLRDLIAKEMKKNKEFKG